MEIINNPRYFPEEENVRQQVSFASAELTKMFDALYEVEKNIIERSPRHDSSNNVLMVVQAKLFAIKTDVRNTFDKTFL